MNQGFGIAIKVFRQGFDAVNQLGPHDDDHAAMIPKTTIIGKDQAHKPLELGSPPLLKDDDLKKRMGILAMKVMATPITPAL